MKYFVIDSTTSKRFIPGGSKIYKDKESLLKDLQTFANKCASNCTSSYCNTYYNGDTLRDASDYLTVFEMDGDKEPVKMEFKAKLKVERSGVISLSHSAKKTAKKAVKKTAKRKVAKKAAKRRTYRR